VRSPVRPLPEPVARWAWRARLLRWLDGGLGWLAVLLVLGLALDEAPAGPLVAAAGILTVLLALVPPLRRGWRPLSAPIACRLSRGLGPGDRAWLVQPDVAELVVVTARRGGQLTIASRRDAAEGTVVRRSRVLLIPADD
jgi:hypothetical protein